MNDLRIVSADDHVIEPPDLWQTTSRGAYATSRPRCCASRCRRTTHACRSRCAITSSRPTTAPTSGPTTTSSCRSLGSMPPRAWQREDYTLDPVNFDQIRPGCLDPIARVADMDLDGVAASLAFPSFTGFCGRVFIEAKDKERRDRLRAGVQRLDARRLVRRRAHTPHPALPHPPLERRGGGQRDAPCRGARVLAPSPSRKTPAKLGLPSIHDVNRSWDPIFRAAVDLQLPLCMHIGSSSGTIRTSDDAPASIWVGLVPMNSQITLFDWLLSDTLQRHPELQTRAVRGRHRLDSVCARARRLLVGAPRRVDEYDDSRTTEHLLPTALPRLLHLRPTRHQEPRQHRRRQRHARDGLPALRLDVAQQSRRRLEPRSLVSTRRRSTR